MVRFDNLLTLHHHHRHRKRPMYSSWMIGKVDCILHRDSGWTHHFQAMVHPSPFVSFLSPSLGRPLVSSFQYACYPSFAWPNQQLIQTQLFASMYVYNHLQ
jgi:hypothetical protein